MTMVVPVRRKLSLHGFPGLGIDQCIVLSGVQLWLTKSCVPQARVLGSKQGAPKSRTVSPPVDGIGTSRPSTKTSAGFTEYSKKTVAEMGGRAIATMVGVVAAMSREGKPIAGRQYGDYAQSSGSNNLVLLIADKDTLARVEQRTVEKPQAASPANEEKLAALEETE